MKRRRLPRYVSAFRSASGRTRYQFRRRGFERYYFRAQPWTEEFEREYAACMAGRLASRIEPGIARTKPGSLGALIVLYYDSKGYKTLKASTKAVYRRMLEKLRAEHGDKSAAGIQRKHIEALVNAKADTPHAADRLLKMWRLLMDLAVANDWRPDDPTTGIKFINAQSDGWHTWTEDEVTKFEATHAPGSRARLAMTLMLYTGQRVSDAIQMGRQHVRDGMISVAQQKTSTRLWIKIHPKLAAELARVPAGQLHFLQTHYGRPYTPKGFPQRMRVWCDQAGLPECTSHGLRKLMAVRLAEAGCSAPQIASITGHKSLQEVQRYIKAADQKRLMLEAMARLAGTEGEQNCLTSKNGGDTSDGKSLTTKGEIDAGGDPNGIRTRVAALKGRCPRPLDDGVVGALRI
jgi:integrase